MTSVSPSGSGARASTWPSRRNPWGLDLLLVRLAGVERRKGPEDRGARDRELADRRKGEPVRLGSDRETLDLGDEPPPDDIDPLRPCVLPPRLIGAALGQRATVQAEAVPGRLSDHDLVAVAFVEDVALGRDREGNQFDRTA